jgi:adenylate cyclase
MFDLDNFHKPEIDRFVHTIVSNWQNLPSLFDSYAAQSQRFMLKRMQVQARIMVIAVLTIIVFFVWVNANHAIKISALKVGFIIEIFILACWFLCQNRIGRRYPHLIFLSLCWLLSDFGDQHRKRF